MNFLNQIRKNSNVGFLRSQNYKGLLDLTLASDITHLKFNRISVAQLQSNL